MRKATKNNLRCFAALSMTVVEENFASTQSSGARQINRSRGEKPDQRCRANDYWFTPDAAAKPDACDEGILPAGAGGVKEAPSALMAPE
jgi:triacylglycerol esterase/lipase EstA (alpha/beta hydrolase family)